MTARIIPSLTVAALVSATAFALAACSGIPADQLETGALAPSQPAATADAKPKITDAKSAPASLAALEAKHRAAPNVDTALAYASGLKSANRTKEARDVLATIHATAPTNAELTGALGLLELDLGNAAKAEKLLKSATAATDADWRYHSGLGVAHAVQGRPAEARAAFDRALAKSPGNKTVLNNLAMTWVMDKKLDRAEGLLRQAKAGDGAPHAVAQNLALAARLRQADTPTERRADADKAGAN